MVHLPSCLNQNSWAILLERELTEVFGTRPKDPSRARQIESLAEALDLVLRMECEPIATSPAILGSGSMTAFGQGSSKSLAETLRKIEDELETGPCANDPKVVRARSQLISVFRMLEERPTGASFQQLPAVQKVFDSRVLLVLMTKDMPGLEAIAEEIPEDVRLTEREKDLLRRLIEARMEEVRSGGR